MLRSIFSVVIGYLIYGISIGILIKLTSVNLHGETSVFFKIGSTLYGIIFSFLSGIITALIARKNKLLHGIVLSILLILIAVAAIYFMEGNHWSEWVNILVIAPFAAMGSWIVARYRKKSKNDAK